MQHLEKTACPTTAHARRRFPRSAPLSASRAFVLGNGRGAGGATRNYRGWVRWLLRRRRPSDFRGQLIEQLLGWFCGPLPIGLTRDSPLRLIDLLAHLSGSGCGGDQDNCSAHQSQSLHCGAIHDGPHSIHSTESPGRTCSNNYVVPNLYKKKATELTGVTLVRLRAACCCCGY
jgi:hypothetical protein